LTMLVSKNCGCTPIQNCVDAVRRNDASKVSHILILHASPA
jgi:hypothetical protein